jgi:hypothetical protein
MAFLRKPNTKISGFWIGVICGCAGSALLITVEAIHITLEGKNLDVLTYLFVFGIVCAVFFVPSGIGGLILDEILQKLSEKGALTLQNGTWIGTLLAGSAGALVGVLWVWLILTVPVHSLPRPEPNLQNFLKIASLNGVEILVAIAIPSVTGAWAGRTLAKQLMTDGNQSGSAPQLP